MRHVGCPRDRAEGGTDSLQSEGPLAAVRCPDPVAAWGTGYLGPLVYCWLLSDSPQIPNQMKGSRPKESTDAGYRVMALENKCSTHDSGNPSSQVTVITLCTFPPTNAASLMFLLIFPLPPLPVPFLIACSSLTKHL